ncbi:MAG: helix-turn-helix domain-containing protein [Chloroflexales bacterium]|nr:helix-turn-helix domain-containing protein [Chloroflexales bacterium]
MTDRDSESLSLGALLARQRIVRGLSRRAQAQALQISPSYLWKLESRAATPSSALLQRIATAFDLDLATLHQAAGVPIPALPPGASFGVWLKHRRRDLGVYQADLAHQIGVSESYLSSIETGRKPLTPAVARRLAPILGIGFDELLGRTGVINDNQLAQLAQLALGEPATTGDLLRRLPLLTAAQRAELAACARRLAAREESR